MPKKILYLGNKLSNHDKNVTTIESLSKHLEALSCHLKTYSNQKNKFFRLASMLFGVIKHYKYDYVIIDTYSTSAFWFAWSCARLSKLLNLKYILILHGGNLPHRLKNNPKICKTLFTNAYLNITPSNYLFEVFKKAGFNNLKIIPNPFNIQDYKYTERKKIQPNLLWVRAFAKLYNPLLAVKVYKLVLEDYPKAKLSMVGPFKDDSINICKAYAEKHKLNVEFTGKLNKDNWLKYAESFDVFINTTNIDNTPLSLIEAMALGLPIVSTNVGGIPYLLKNEKNALLVNPNNEVEMKNAIDKLLKDYNIYKHINQNALSLVKSLDWENTKIKWKEVLA